MEQELSQDLKKFFKYYVTAGNIWSSSVNIFAKMWYHLCEENQKQDFYLS